MRKRTALLWRTRPLSSEAGFGLAEVMVALSIVVMVAVLSAPVFINSLSRVANLGTRQTAVTVGSQQLEYVRSLKGSALVRNRPQNLVNTMTVSATQTVNPSPAAVDLSQDVVTPGANDLLNYDPTATPADGSGAAVPLVKTTTINNVPYTVTTFINACNLSSSANTCTRVAAAGSHQVYRITVDVAWPRTNGENCKSATTGRCEYVVVDLRDPSADPIFTRLSPPVFSTIIETYQTFAVAPIVVHPLQRVSFAITGSNFQYLLAMQSGDPADIVTVGTVTPVAVTATFAASATVGTHSLVIANPDGGSVTVPIAVATSIPKISNVTPAAGFINKVNTLLVSGSDFFTDTAGNIPQVSLSGSLTLAGAGKPTVIQPYSSNTGTETMTTPGLLSVSLPANAFPAVTGYTSQKFSGNVTVTNPDGGTITYANFTLALS